MIIAVLAVSTLAASFIMGLTGFGFGLVAMGVLPYVMTVARANGHVLILGTTVIVAALVPVVRRVKLDLIWPLFVGAAIGVPIGVFYLVRMNESVLRITLGVVIIAAVATQMRRTDPERAAMNARTPTGRLITAGVGMAAGMLGGAFSVGGPPVVILIHQTLTDKTDIKANLLAYFMFSVAVRAPLLAASEILTREILINSLVVLPLLVAGLIAGNLLHTRLSTKVVRYVVMVMLIVSATLLILEGV